MRDPLNPSLDKEWKGNLSIHMISDLHGFAPHLPGGDLLIVAGDHTARDTEKEYWDFWRWLCYQPYKKFIVISGNHDGYIEKHPEATKELGEAICYLCDSGTEFGGLKIWGTPWSLTFDGINPKCTAFTGYEALLKSKYDLIPDDIDILISHGPPQGILDDIEKYHAQVEYTGSWELLYAMDRVKPKMLVTGHIHENGLQTLLYKHQGPNMMCVNTAYVDERYMPRNAFMACEWDGHNFIKFDKVAIH